MDDEFWAGAGINSGGEGAREEPFATATFAGGGLLPSAFVVATSSGGAGQIPVLPVAICAPDKPDKDSFMPARLSGSAASGEIGVGQGNSSALEGLSRLVRAAKIRRLRVVWAEREAKSEA